MAFRETYRRRVSQSEVSHLLDVNVVVEVDQVSPLLLAHGRRGRRGGLVGGGGGGGGAAAGPGGGRGAAAADGDWTDVSACSWGREDELRMLYRVKK